MKQFVRDFVALAVLPLCCSLAVGAVLYVDRTPEDGTWVGVYTDLQQALSAATSGDEIWVAEGVYRPTTGSQRDRSFDLRDEVAVYGGFSGTESDRGARDWNAHPTLLSGDIGVEGDDSDNSYHVVVGAYLATLDGFVITQGRTAGRGAGMLNEWDMWGHSGLSFVANSVFLDNRAEQAGGGLYNGPEASAHLTNVAFVDNWAGESGGGLANHTDSHAELVNSLFIGNSAGVRGGAISNQWSSMSAVNSTIVDNSAPQGGGLDTDELASADFINTIFWGNTAASGAQIFSAAEYIQLAYSDLEGGLAGIAGPGWVEDGGGNINENPLFAGADVRDYRLTPDSPCVDAAPWGPLFDLDGKPRPIDGDGDGYTAFDVGAYELPEPSTFTLVAIGAGTLLAFGRRRRRRAAY